MLQFGEGCLRQGSRAQSSIVVNRREGTCFKQPFNGFKTSAQGNVKWNRQHRQSKYNSFGTHAKKSMRLIGRMHAPKTGGSLSTGKWICAALVVVYLHFSHEGLDEI
jgi:hypothetical protein